MSLCAKVQGPFDLALVLAIIFPTGDALAVKVFGSGYGCRAGRSC